MEHKLPIFWLKPSPHFTCRPKHPNYTLFLAKRKKIVSPQLILHENRPFFRLNRENISGGSKGGHALPPSLLGEPKITLSTEHHLKEANEQEIGLKMLEMAILETQIFKIYGTHTDPSFENPRSATEYMYILYPISDQISLKTTSQSLEGLHIPVCMVI